MSQREAEMEARALEARAADLRSEAAAAAALEALRADGSAEVVEYPEARVTRVRLPIGARVVVSGYSYGEAEFLGFDREAFACPDTHLSAPGCRIARVRFDRYGESGAWESNVSYRGAPIYAAERRREARS